MRPDMEEYEELQPSDEVPRSRAMSWLVLAVAVGGFGALAYYAYHSGTHTRDGDMLVVQADTAPIKQTPTDPEGENFANKDKTIYDVIAPSGQAPSEKVEKLLPEPEKPNTAARAEYANETATQEDMPAPVTATPPAATTFVNKNLSKSVTAVDPVDEQSLKQPGPGTAMPEQKQASSPVAENKPMADMKPAAASEAPGAPTFVNELPANAKKPEAIPAAKATTAKETTAKANEAKKPAVKTNPDAAKKPAAAKATGAYQIQLGAYKSEAEATANWKKISGKFAGVLAGGPVIVKADLPSGTFYRLRTGGFASSDAAKAACAKLSAQGQACFPAGK